MKGVEKGVVVSLTFPKAEPRAAKSPETTASMTDSNTATHTHLLNAAGVLLIQTEEETVGQEVPHQYFSCPRDFFSNPDDPIRPPAPISTSRYRQRGCEDSGLIRVKPNSLPSSLPQRRHFLPPWRKGYHSSALLFSRKTSIGDLSTRVE
jgi:hypothetical protein